MPIYDVKCLKCNNISELLLNSTNKELRCPKCDSREVEKLISVTSSMTGKSSTSIPDLGSTCCGTTPDKSNCEGPGSCCGNTGIAK